METTVVCSSSGGWGQKFLQSRGILSLSLVLKDLGIRLPFACTALPTERCSHGMSRYCSCAVLVLVLTVNLCLHHLFVLCTSAAAKGLKFSDIEPHIILNSPFVYCIQINLQSWDVRMILDRLWHFSVISVSGKYVWRYGWGHILEWNHEQQCTQHRSVGH